MILRLVLCLTMLAAPVAAQDVGMAGLNPQTARVIAPVVRAANRHFARMPQVRLTSQMAGLCGGDAGSDPLIRYCTTLNAIYVAADLTARTRHEAEAVYRVAHAFGHAIQVRHGVADQALARIAAEPSRAAELRAMVTRQVECLAGILHRRAIGLGRTSPSDWMTDEPFAGSHWGADPIAARAQVSIGLDERDAWFRKGRDSDRVAACAAGEIGTTLLERAERP